MSGSADGVCNRVVIYFYDASKNLFRLANEAVPGYQEARERFYNYAPKIWSPKNMTDEQKKEQFKIEHEQSVQEKYSSTPGFSRIVTLTIQIAGTLFVVFVGAQTVKAML